MPSPRELRRVRRARTRLTVHRARRLAGLVVLAGMLLVTLLLTAFGASPSTTAAPLATTVGDQLLAVGPPEPEVVAARDRLRLHLPVSQSALTAIGYHDAGPAALELEALGHQGNRGLLGRLVDRIFGRGETRLVWYQLDGDRRSALDVGAPPATDVFSPVDGTIVGIGDYVLDGRARGVRIDIQPSSAPSLLVSVTRLRADPSLTVGAPVLAASSRLGSMLDLSRLERQALARYTQDAGNHVSIEVRTAPTLTLG